MPAPQQRSSRLLAWLLVLIVAASIIYPAAVVLWTTIRGAFANLSPTPAPPQAGGSLLEVLPPLTLAPNLPLLGQTLAWALGIALIATVLAWPAAWLIRAKGWSIVGLLCVPLLLPTYLCYTAYGILRSPGWFLGNWLEELAKAGWTYAPILAGRIIAALGLALWAWPISAIVLGATVKRLDQSVLDALRLDASPSRRRAQTLYLSRSGVAAAIGAVTLVMIGSAVPLHLSQVPTYATKIWLDITLAPGSWRVWAAAWPLIAIAIIAGWLIAARLVRTPARHDDLDPSPAPRRAPLPAALTSIIWTASVLIPLALFAISLSIVNRGDHTELALDQWHAVPRFFKLAGDPLINSFQVSAVTALIALIITTAIWQALSSNHHHLALYCARALLIFGLLPGILVGSALSMAASFTDFTLPIADTPWITILGHTARFGFVPALLGIWLAAIEPRQERELRALDGALNFYGWTQTSLPLQAGALIAAALATGALSLHEIESAIILQPPGSPSLAQMLLNELHQLRMQDLSAAGVVLVSGGLFIALLASLGLRKTSLARE